MRKGCLIPILYKFCNKCWFVHNSCNLHINKMQQHGDIATCINFKRETSQGFARQLVVKPGWHHGGRGLLLMPFASNSKTQTSSSSMLLAKLKAVAPNILLDIIYFPYLDDPIRNKNRPPILNDNLKILRVINEYYHPYYACLSSSLKYILVKDPCNEKIIYKIYFYLILIKIRIWGTTFIRNLMRNCHVY